MKPKGTATLEMENKFCVSAQPRERDISFPTGTAQRASSQRWLSGGNCAGLCVQKTYAGSWLHTGRELSGKTQKASKHN